MKGIRAFTALPLAALALATGCGDEESASDEAVQGGEAEFAVSAQPDALDPALSYTLPGIEPMSVVYTPLLSYRRAEGDEGTELIPALAEALPEVSEDGTTYTLTLRDGLSYSDGSEVKASDFEHTIKRVLNLESGGASFYLGIEGAEEYLDSGDAEADISGIETDDETGEIEIQLTAPDATFANVLAMNFAGLVPGDTPFANQTKNPAPGVGPYEITSSEPNRQFVLERNENFAELDIPELPTGNLDRITVRVEPNTQTQAQDVLSNELDYMQDPPPPDLLPRIDQEASDRFTKTPAGATTFVFLNVEEPPFDDERVRRAAAMAIDKPAIARLYGGLIGPTCNFLPPVVPGYEELDPCPTGDPLEAPDLDEASRLISQAGAEGAPVKVWGPIGGNSEKAALAVAEAWSEIGLAAEPEIVDFAVYVPTIGNEESGAQAGVLDFFQDFPHPANYLQNFSGDVIAPKNNLNFSRVDDAELTDQINELKQEADIETAAAGWADVDREIVESAYAIPLGHADTTTFVSDRVDPDCPVASPVFGHDYASFCLSE